MKTYLPGTIALFFLLCVSATAGESSGSGVLIGPNGQVLTVAHVVKGCKKITVQLPLQSPSPATVSAKDAQNDLALLNANIKNRDYALLRTGSIARAGETVLVSGYPLPGILSSEVNITTGVVSSDAGLLDDTRYYQISAPVQPGNSGGPLLDSRGNVLGLVAAKLDFRVAGLTGALPENVNFAVKSDMAAIFLNSIGARYFGVPAKGQPTNISSTETARKVTVHIVCQTTEEISDVTPPGRGRTTRSPTNKSKNDWQNKIHSDWFQH
jgi:S1-C subfamily serine protease